MRYSIDETTSGLSTADIVSTADLKAHLRVTHSDEDALIESLRDVAVNYVENMTNARLGDRASVIYYDALYSSFEVPVGPMTNDTHTLEYATGASTYTALTEGTHYYIDFNRTPARVTMISTPTAFTYAHSKMKLSCTIGYAEADVPAALVHAIKLLVSHMYELRQPEITGTISTLLKLGLEALLNPYRIISFR